MIDPARVYAVTLAAGLARRFGADKLAAPCGDGTVLDAALAPLEPFEWLGRAVVAADGRFVPGRSVIANHAPERGMGHSVSLAAGAADAAGADYLLVTLGDMPRISPATITRLLEACPDRPDALAACQPVDAAPGPPALFGRDWFGRLQSADGDKGARDWLRDPANGAALVRLPAEEALDIDTPADLEALRGLA